MRNFVSRARGYAIIDLAEVSALCGFRRMADFQRAHCQWVEDALSSDLATHDDRWSESVAVGSEAYVERVKRELDIRARNRDVSEVGGTFALREPVQAYQPHFAGKNDLPF